MDNLKELTFYIVDVFAERRYGGNQLAVFRSSGQLGDTQMQSIAKEMHFSESTFIQSEEPSLNSGYPVRIFTPKLELPFAGHPTLGTAYIINREVAQTPAATVILNLKAGQIPVTFAQSEHQGEILWMEQLQPTFGRTFKTQAVAEILNLDVTELDDRFPIQTVSTGVPTIIVPLQTLNSVKHAHVNRERYFEFIKLLEAKTLLVFCTETYDANNDLHVRFFADYFGIPEDPATGSANGCLAAYLIKHHYFGSGSKELRVEQGYQVDRPSLLFLKGEERDRRIHVHVGGNVILVAKGTFFAT